MGPEVSPTWSKKIQAGLPLSLSPKGIEERLEGLFGRGAGEEVELTLDFEIFLSEREGCFGGLDHSSGEDAGQGKAKLH